MLDLELRFEDGVVQISRCRLPLDIGRAVDAGLRLKAWRVAKRHARLERREDGVFVDDLGSLAGTLVNGQRIAQYGPLHPGDTIVIGPCMICLREILPSIQNEGLVAPFGVDAKLVLQPDRLALGAANDAAATDQNDNRLSGAGNGSEEKMVDNNSTSLISDSRHIAGFNDDASPGLSENARARQSSGGSTSLALLLHHRRRLHMALLDALDLRRRDIANMSDAALRSEAKTVLADIIRHDQELPDSVDRSELLQEVVNEAVGLGPLEPLLADPRISEIMVNRHDEIFIEAQGRLERHRSGFSSEQAVLGVIERIVSPLGRRIDESSPMVDARLGDGSRVNAIIPPIALRGASLTIRKFPQNRLLMEDLVRVGALDACMRDFLSVCVRERKNIIVSGGTGSGKTTLLNILSNCIPLGERVVTIEDAAELRLDHEHLVTLEARPANLEGRGKIDIRDLVRNALRMRPDRIVIGECRGGEAFDMLAAMNTGHEGSLTTLHANSARDALSRLETMILMAGMDLPLVAVREHIAASIDLLVQQARLSDGRRVITSIVEVTGIESGRIQTQELFHYQAGPPALFRGCGAIPEFFGSISLTSVGLTMEAFNQQTLLQQASATFDPSPAARIVMR